MSDQKLKLSEELLARAAATTGTSPTSGTNHIEVLKNERATIEANSKVQVAQLQVMKEAIEAFKSVSEVIKSHNQVKATEAEWQGRITQAELEIRKAEVGLQIARESNQLKAEELAQSRDLINRLLDLFDMTMQELMRVDCSKNERAELRAELLRISDQLVLLKK